MILVCCDIVGGFWVGKKGGGIACMNCELLSGRVGVLAAALGKVKVRIDRFKLRS